jgi:predicted P-loop ATPase/GTPase
MLILINGLFSYNSGKTTFGRALAAEMVSRGLGPGVMKPHSAHNFWDMYAHSLACRDLGKLVSRDALQLAQAAELDAPIEIVNPHHQLLCPRDPLAVVEGQTGVPPAADELLAERVTRAEGPRSTLFVHRQAKSFLAPEEFLASLARGVDVVEEFGPGSPSRGEERVHQAVAECYAALRASHPNLLVESLNDLALPGGLAQADVDVVATTAANVLLVYRGEDFFRASRALRVRRVQDHIPYASPALGYRLPFMTEEVRADLDRLSQTLEPVASAVIDFGLRKAI